MYLAFLFDSVHLKKEKKTLKRYVFPPKLEFFFGNTSPAATSGPTPPLGNCGALAGIIIPRGGALANLERARSRALAIPGATPGAVDTHVENSRGKDQQFVADWLVESLRSMRSRGYCLWSNQDQYNLDDLKRKVSLFYNM